MINKTFNRKRIAFFSTILAVICALVFSMYYSAPCVGAMGGGSGRLIITGFGGVSIYAVDADPNIGLQSFDMATNYPGNPVDFPSVANNGAIAFSFRGPGDDNYRVWAMDADGSNRRQLTFTRAVPTSDVAPTISPDGTKVAFISNRFDVPTFPDSSQKNPEVFIVNTDGSNLHQVTPSEQEPQHGSNPNTYITDFGWASDSTLIVAGARVVPGQPALKYGLFSFNSDGTGQTSLNLLHPAYGTSQSFDVRGGHILYGNSNRLFVFDLGGNVLNQVNGTSFGEQLLGHGSARLSPDGSRIGYMSGTNNGSLITMNLDGTGRVTVRTNLGVGTLPFWWTTGGQIPVPARIELTPNVLQIPNDGTSATISPALYDSNGNLIFRSARFAVTCDATHPCDVPFNPFGGFQLTPFNKINLTNPSTTNIGYVTVCGTNGVQACSIVGLNRDINFAELRSSVPTANTNGAGGDGVFTIRRTSSQANSTFAVDFTTGGTAVRGLDYSLNVAGNSVLIPAGQNTVDIRVTPLLAAGNKTVSLSITAPPNASYLTVAGQDSAIVNIIDNGSPTGPLSLSSISTSHGGNGGVIASTIYGSNIGDGATVKLTRAGQTDIPGANVHTAVGGKSIIAVFDLRGASPGSWNVVVTNPDSSTQQLTNGFQVEPNSPNRLTVQISGAGVIRASHSRSNYDVIYTNHGNTDVYGVVLFITGVARNECATPADVNCTYLDTPLQNIPDLPGQDPLPAWVRQVPNIVPVDLPNVSGPGIRQVGAIPVLIPRIPANTSRTFRFSMRFSVVGETALQKINASILPPLVTAVTVPGASKPTIAMRALTPDDAFSDGAACVHSIVQNAINCALGFVPGEQCLAAGLAYMQNLAGAVGNNSYQNLDSTAAFSGAQQYAGLISIMTCLKSATPLGTFLNVLGCLAGVYDSCVTCLGPDACNPFNLYFVQSADPNEKTGVRRLTPQNYIPSSNMLYGISFENKPDATAPAQDVVITDQLDTTKLDVTTFELGQMTFGDTVINVPTGLTSFTTEVDLRPANDLLVSVNANLDQNTGLVTWTFLSLDPFTRQTPTNALAGFLPPNIDGVQGAGKVLFTISPKNTVTTGDEIRNHATIIFDLNAPITTNEWLNTIDDSKPISSVQPLAAQQSSTTFTVNWSGNDTGSGINDYTLYVSENGGPFNPSAVGTTNTTTQFTGAYDTTYSFYTISRDNAGNVEGAKVVGDATTHTPAAPATISGTVTYGNAIPAATRYVSNVLISGAGSPPVSVFTGAPGASAGTYALSGFGAGSYTVTPTKTGGVNNITSFDAAKIAQHVAGISNLTGNQLIVADASNNGSISSFDAAQIANYVVSSSPAGTSGTWKFNPVNRTYASVNSSVNGEDFSALLMGEVSGNWTNTGARPSNGPAKSIAVKSPDLITSTGSEVVIPIEVQGAANKGIISYEINMSYDPSVIQPVADPVDLSGTVSSRLTFAFNADQPGILRVAVYGAYPIDTNGVLMNLRFTAVGAPGSVSRLILTHMMFNEGDPEAIATDGRVRIWDAAANQAE